MLFFFKYRFLKRCSTQPGQERGGFDKKSLNKTHKIKTVKFPQKVASDEILSVSKYRRHTSALRVIDISDWLALLQMEKLKLNKLRFHLHGIREHSCSS